MQAQKLLVADIGGTNARFAIADLASLELSQIKYFKAADYPSFEEVFDLYTGGLNELPKRACLAVASPVQSDSISFTNNSWKFSQKALAAGFDDFLVINDFEAVAFAVEALHSDKLLKLGEGTASGHVRAVMGPGTGLGMAILVRASSGLLALPTEGGHASWTPLNPYQSEIYKRYQKRFEFVCREEILSGRGLVQLAQAMADIDGIGLDDEECRPDWLSSQALQGHSFALKVIEEFFSILGAVAGDFVLQTGATGGLYLAGGILPRIAGLLEKSSFRENFEAKGRYRSYMQPIPSFLMPDEDLGLKGAAVCLSSRKGGMA